MEVEKIALPTDRKFGVFAATILAVLAAWSFHRHRMTAAQLLAALSAVTALLAVVRPGVLHLPNRGWMGLGLLLNKVTSPIILGLVFFLVITPVGLALRLAGRDELRLRRPAAGSHWIRRAAPAVTAASFRNQF